MKAEPLSQHHWLQKLVGDWTYETECDGGPDQPPVKANGTQTFRPLGDIWIVGEGDGEMPGGGPAKTRITLGYDSDKGRFVGSWVGSMMTCQWIYDGALDEAQKVLTLDSVGPSFADDGKLGNYQDIITVVSNDHHILTAQTQGPDGAWKQFMETHYRRV